MVATWAFELGDDLTSRREGGARLYLARVADNQEAEEDVVEGLAPEKVEERWRVAGVGVSYGAA